MPWVTRSDAMDELCPHCGAQPGEQCSGARRKRRSVHSERMNAALARRDDIKSVRLDVDPDGNIRDPEGNVRGRLTGMSLDLQTDLEWGNLRRGGGSGEERLDLPSETSNPPEGVQGDSLRSQTSLLRSPIEEVWEHYQATVNGAKRRKLDSARTTCIRRALKVRTVEECKAAIDGLSVSAYHQGHNDQKTAYLDIQYALGMKSESPDARIDKMASQRPKSSSQHVLARFSPALREVVVGHMNTVKRGMVEPSEMNVRLAGESEHWLIAHAKIKVASRDDNRIEWVAL